MRQITLTTTQMDIVFKALDKAEESLDGRFDIDIDIDENTLVNAKGSLIVDGYHDNDYFNGTGAWIETYRSAAIDLTLFLFDEDGEEVKGVRLDPTHEQDAEKYLERR